MRFFTSLIPPEFPYNLVLPYYSTQLLIGNVHSTFRTIYNVVLHLREIPLPVTLRVSFVHCIKDNSHVVTQQTKEVINKKHFKRTQIKSKHTVRVAPGAISFQAGRL